MNKKKKFLLFSFVFVIIISSIIYYYISNITINGDEDIDIECDISKNHLEYNVETGEPECLKGVAKAQ